MFQMQLHSRGLLQCARSRDCDFYCTRLAQGILLLMPREIMHQTIDILKKYAIFSKVNITDQQ